MTRARPVGNWARSPPTVVLVRFFPGSILGTVSSIFRGSRNDSKILVSSEKNGVFEVSPL